MVRNLLGDIEDQLTTYGLTMPETTVGPGWGPTRALYMRRKMFFVFGDRKEPPSSLTMMMKLPVSADMVQDLYFVRESKGWFKLHDWVIVRFGPGDDVMAELDTLKGWMVQSYCAIAPKKLARRVQEGL